MVDLFIQATISNLVVATILACVAWVVQKRIRSASLTNLLWALVLVKLVTPPLYTLSLFEVPRIADIKMEQAEPERAASTSLDAIDFEMNSETAVLPTSTLEPSEPIKPKPAPQLGTFVVVSLFAIWTAVSSVLLLLSLIRVFRFHRLLLSSACTKPESINELAGQTARKLGVKSPPRVFITTAELAPFVWWMSFRSVIVISDEASRQLSEHDLKMVIAHELAHIKRRDHWFRWLEWIALIGFWWNPLVWWTRKQLRISEEMACDALVLESIDSDANKYANSLLNVAELLASPAVRPPALASALNSGGSLERRLKMLIAEKSWKVPTALRTAIVLVAVCTFPIGLVYAQDFEAVERRLKNAVEEGELSEGQAKAMLETLRQSSEDDLMEAKKQRYMQLAEGIKESVNAGEISAETGERMLIAMRSEMFGEGARTEEVADPETSSIEERKRRYEEYVREVRAKLQSGDISYEEAERVMAEIRDKMMAESPAEGRQVNEREALQRRLMEEFRAIEAALQAGEISKDEAREKIEALRRSAYEERDKEPEIAFGVEVKQEQMLQIAREIQQAMSSGELSREEGMAKLRDLQRAMTGTRGEDEEKELDRDSRRQFLIEAARKIQQAVQNGDISEEEAKEKIEALRRELAGDRQ